MTDFVVVKTHPDLLPFVDSLQRKNAEALSFYPHQVFEREAANGRLYLGILNGEPCGYIYRGAAPLVRCHQVCIDYSLRLRHYGAALVQVLEFDAITEKASAISLRCGFDLGANDFWKALGYQCVDVQSGGVRRQRRINVWRKALAPELFADLIVEPESGNTSAATWAKHKQTGLVSQFVRGKRMAQYRAIVETPK